MDSHIPPQRRLTIGFMLASIHTGAGRAVWPGLLDTAEEQDVNLICFPGGRLHAGDSFENQRNSVFHLISEQCVDGLVSWSSTLGGVLTPQEVNTFHKRYQSLPMISLAQFMEGIPTISVDSYHGMRALLDHLIEEHGYTRIAFIRGPEVHYSAQERYRAYLDALQAHHLPFVPELVTRPLRWESGAEAIHILLDERNLTPGVDFQAIAAVSDLLAIWALKTLQSRGYQIPVDVTVTGFNNSIEERLATPPLTTVDLPFYQQGARAVEALLTRLSGKEVPALMTLPSRLVVRQSCGCPSNAVAMAAFEPVPSIGDLRSSDEEVSLQSIRSACLAEMTSAAGITPAQSVLWMEPVFDTWHKEVETISSSTSQHTFISILDHILDHAMREKIEIPLWHNVISILRRWTLPLIPAEYCARAENILGQARVVVSELTQRSQSYWQWQSERQLENLRETNRALLTTFNLEKLCDVLFESLPGLNIPAAYLAIYDDPTLEFARLVLACTEQGRLSLPEGGRRFPAQQVVPPDVLPQNRRYSLVVEPLFFQDKTIGFVVFELGPRDADIYELLRVNLSSAIQGAFLFQEIQQARLTAEKADRIKTRLLANVSHELRTPLHIIIGYTHNILERPTLDPVLLPEIRQIQDSAEHQLRVINDLLDLSRAEIEELDLNLEFLDPHPLLVEVFQSIAQQHTDHPLQWKLDIPDRLPMLRADGLRLRQVLLNLLSNARKFTESGQITLGANIALPNIHFWVSDTGWGISPDQQERIFEPFVTMEHNRRISGGIGLGLSITRHLVALHGGEMTLDSVPGKGSTFHIYLPLPALDQDQVSFQNAQPVLLLLSSSNTPAPEIVTIGANQNLQIIPIHTPDELEAILRSTRPMAVAWDLSSAQPGDWNLIRRLRHHPSLSQSPFILYGQAPDSTSSTPALSVGLTSFVAKTPGHQTILEALHTLCPQTCNGMILIVDDDPVIRTAHQSLAQTALPQYPIRTAADGIAALAIMKDEVPALVLLDLVMPEMSGTDVLDQMRADPRLRQVPVIILSNKLLNLDDVKRIEHHTRVTFQSKGVWSDTETQDALNRALSGSDNLPAHTSALVKQVVVYFQQNYHRPLSRWEIAEAIGMSEDYLTRIFNRELGISPWEYLNRYRILQAKILLNTTANSIGAIAHQVGFKDQTYFSRVFNKLTGCSPQSYRDGHSTEDNS